MHDPLGDEMKTYEASATGHRLDGQKPVYVRLDGRGFSRFTSHMARPFDASMTDLMCQVTEYLVDKSSAVCGYTQSDEISLVYLAKPPEEAEGSQIFFDGRHFKMTSQLASMATARFLIGALGLWPEKTEAVLPTFDARVFELPTKEVAGEAFLWRVIDCERNAISMIAQSHFSHKELQHVSTVDQVEMLKGIGVSLFDYPSENRHGTFVRRKLVEKPLDEKTLLAIPEAHRERAATAQRRAVVRDVVRDFKNITNRTDFIFNAADSAY